jgi:hypothetical protein
MRVGLLGNTNEGKQEQQQLEKIQQSPKNQQKRCAFTQEWHACESTPDKT